MIKLMIWDLDGTLRETASGKTFIDSPDDQKPKTGALEAIAYYHSKGFICVGATNQGGCAAIDPATGKPRKSIANMIEEQTHTLSLFPQLQSIYACSDFNGNECWQITKHSSTEIHKSWGGKWIGEYRKPGAGMIHAAVLKPGVGIVHAAALMNDDFCIDDIEAIWMIGDRPEDKGSAEAAGINFMWADIVRNRFIPGIHEQDLRGIEPDTLLRFLAI